MPDPLPADIVARLRSDSTTALAASLILAGSFPDIVSWALRAFSVKDSELKASVPTYVGRKSANIKESPRRPAAKSDQALLAVMRANPGSSLADLIRLGRRPRTSTVLSLKRLEEAGLVEHPSKGQYRAVDQAPPKPAWIDPLSGRHVARHAADGRVRDQMTTAGGSPETVQEVGFEATSLLHVALLPRGLPSGGRALRYVNGAGLVG